MFAGAITNDWIASDLWATLEYCTKTLWQRHFRGWKRCWDFAWRGQQTWRKKLRPQLMGQMIGILRQRLRQHDKTQKKNGEIRVPILIIAEGFALRCCDTSARWRASAVCAGAVFGGLRGNPERVTEIAR